MDSAAPSPRIPDHELLRRIGRGAYGEVWLARNVMGTWRAVKIVRHDHFSSDKPYEREFAGIRKFEPVSRTHESQVDILHVGRENGAGYFYYVMELADDVRAGQEIDPETYAPRTLHTDLSEKGRLTAGECLEVGIALATALDHLHAHGLIHRDIKPSNIIFVHGRPKLADIGLVAALDEAMSFVGTEGYVAPEGPGTMRADLFSLGRVLYQMHTGLPQRRFPEIPPDLADGDDAELARELNLIILKASAPQTERRHSSATKLREELLLLQSGCSIRRLRQREKRARLFVKAGASLGVIALLALAGGAIAWRGERKAAEAKIAEERREKAEISERARTRELIQSSTASGLMRLDAGDSFGALLPLIEALERESDPQRIASARTRIACILAYTPHIARAFFHDGAVNRLVLHPDGRRLLTASSDGTARVWRLDADDAPPLVLKHPAEVRWASWGANGTRIVTACTDGTVRLWNTEDGAKLQPDFRHDGAVLRAELSRDGATVVSGCEDGTFRIWDAATGAVRVSELLDGRVIALAISSDARQVAASGDGGSCNLGLWEASSGRKLHGPLQELRWVHEASFSPDDNRLGAAGWALAATYDARTGAMSSKFWQGFMLDFFAWNRDGTRFITGGEDRRAMVVNAADGTVVSRIRHAQPATGACFSPGGSRVATLSDDGTARLWASTDGTPLAPPLRHSGRVNGATFTADGGGLVTAGFDGMVRVWELNPGSSKAVTLDHGHGKVRQARFSKDGSLFLTAGDDHHVRLWNARTGTAAIDPLDAGSAVFGVAFDPADRRFAAITAAWAPGAKNKVLIRDTATGSVAAPDLEVAGHGLGVSFSADGRELITLTAAHATVNYVNERVHVQKGSVVLRRWNAETGAPLADAVDTGDGAWFAALSNDGRRAAIAFQSPAPAFQTWDTATGKPLTARMPAEAGVWHLEFSPDGNRLAVTTRHFPSSGTRVYDVQTGTPVSPPLPHNDDVFFAAFSPDGSRLATACNDGAARVWEVNTGTPLTVPLRHEWKAVHAMFSGDGTRLITASGDTTARVWDVATGELLAPPLPHRNRLFWSWFHPDGRSVIAADGDGYCSLWQLPSSDAPVATLRRQAELLAAERRDSRLGMVPLTRAQLRERWDAMHEFTPTPSR